MRHLAIFLSLTAALVLGVADVARAKGPTQLVIDGETLPGPITLTLEDKGAIPFFDLGESSGLWDAIVENPTDRFAADAPTTELGSELVFSWTIVPPSGDQDIVRQLVYPTAEGGPLVYTEPGQADIDGLVTRGGWFRARGLTDDVLERVGVPVSALRPATPPTPPAPPTSGSDWRVFDVPWPIVVGAAAASIGWVALARRRRAPVSAV